MLSERADHLQALAKLTGGRREVHQGAWVLLSRPGGDLVEGLPDSGAGAR
ncbi:hypothetical protein DAETH_42070 (plasmid) [Deinococcus aetherius]|uniref:Uncharacterized protein n=1 Tax=Deinococcus aetherius TaxID=200252 RepID=A0ABM8AK73_9DEIO|nr:hypothetical protein DAETH_42070 [Deinococcus aetherius]